MQDLAQVAFTTVLFVDKERDDAPTLGVQVGHVLVVVGKVLELNAAHADWGLGAREVENSHDAGALGLLD